MAVALFFITVLIMGRDRSIQSPFVENLIPMSLVPMALLMITVAMGLQDPMPITHQTTPRMYTMRALGVGAFLMFTIIGNTVYQQSPFVGYSPQLSKAPLIIFAATLIAVTCNASIVWLPGVVITGLQFFQTNMMYTVLEQVLSFLPVPLLVVACIVAMGGYILLGDSNLAPQENE